MSAELEGSGVMGGDLESVVEVVDVREVSAELGGAPFVMEPLESTGPALWSQRQCTVVAIRCSL